MEQHCAVKKVKLFLLGMKWVEFEATKLSETCKIESERQLSDGFTHLFNILN